METEILKLEDIKLLVNAFYDKVRSDHLLAPIFNEVIEDRWPEHLVKMYTFWQTVLLGERTYTGSPFPPHARLPVMKEHFDRWLELFYSTLDENFEGEKVAEAKWRASRIAEVFQMRIEMYREDNPFLI
ncbi:group III truncated hemoglobin [Gelidibacter maritimus]|uniref:Group III truncated hemoglobin n=1 Tax=Gelidibacter maritimus TaxID=2761487 RepID=A0A7W2M5Q3_9FLAO|nr:group III truncated hemoglobin [Gelidibacter maritimus]MBA6153199.1 group III truncated hemoglobin [Gelidibacter maritimus]